MNMPLAKEGIKMATRHKKKRLTSVIITEVQAKTTRLLLRMWNKPNIRLPLTGVWSGVRFWKTAWYFLINYSYTTCLSQLRLLQQRTAACMAEATNVRFSQVWSLWSPRSKDRQADPGVGLRAPFPGRFWQMVVSYWTLPGQRESTFPTSPFHKAVPDDEGSTLVT